MNSVNDIYNHISEDIADLLREEMDRYIIYTREETNNDVSFIEFLKISGAFEEIRILLMDVSISNPILSLSDIVRKSIEEAPLASIEEFAARAVKRGFVKEEALWPQYLADSIIFSFSKSMV